MTVISIQTPARGLLARSHAEGLAALGSMQTSRVGRYAPAALAMLATLAFSVSADAQSAFTGGVQAQTMLNNICTFILGPFGQTLAVLGIIGIGMSWMFGRASLGLVAGVIGGIIIMFAAGYIGSTLTGGSSTGS